MHPTRLPARWRGLPLAVTLVALAAATLLVAEPAQAALVDRGNGMVYDTDTNLTWLTDWNQAAGSAFDDGSLTTDGKMTWASAQAWADSLVFGGHSDWRLPTTPPCLGFNCTSSEIGHLWYSELGNVAGLGMKNAGPFTGIAAGSTYWTGTNFQGSTGDVYYFNVGGGSQSVFPVGSLSHAVAVRVGDVSPVPEPASGALTLAGLVGLGTLLRRRAACARR